MTLSVTPHYSWVKAKSLKLPTSPQDPHGLSDLTPDNFTVIHSLQPPCFHVSGPLPGMLFLKHPCVYLSPTFSFVSNTTFSGSFLQHQFPRLCPGCPLPCSSLIFLHSTYHFGTNCFIYMLSTFNWSTLFCLLMYPNAWNCVWHLVGAHNNLPVDCMVGCVCVDFAILWFLFSTLPGMVTFLVSSWNLAFVPS